jgi:hypothetical protein
MCHIENMSLGGRILLLEINHMNCIGNRAGPRNKSSVKQSRNGHQGQNPSGHYFVVLNINKKSFLAIAFVFLIKITMVNNQEPTCIARIEERFLVRGFECQE